MTVCWITNVSTECQQSNPKPFACYASAPNDVWSLGVILVNLTCGRNPWKRASMDDSTFRAYMRDRNFLQTILPVSDSLDCILQRIFEVDPKRRITLEELRKFIMYCPQLGRDSAEASLPPTPQYSPVEKPVDSSLTSFASGLETVPVMDPLPVQQYPPFSGPQFNTQVSFIHNLPTPPGSANGSPRQTPYTYQARPAAPTASFANQTGYITSVQAPFQTWSRCANYLPNLASRGCWRNAPVF